MTTVLVAALLAFQYDSGPGPMPGAGPLSLRMGSRRVVTAQQAGGGGSVLRGGYGGGAGMGRSGGLGFDPTGGMGGGYGGGMGGGMGGGYGGGYGGGMGGGLGGGANGAAGGPGRALYGRRAGLTAVAHQPTYQAAALGATGVAGHKSLTPLGNTPPPTVKPVGAGAAASTASKWDLTPSAGAPDSAPTGMAGVLLNGLSGGPLSDSEAEALAAELTGVKAPHAADDHSTDDLAALVKHGVDPDLSDLQSGLDALLPSLDPSQPRAIDGEALRSWFKVLDVSKDDTISFLEWRDRTGLSLELFRRVDKSGEGVLSFDEFARAIVLNAASQGNRSIAPELLAWAEGKDGSAPGAAVPATKSATELGDDEALDLAARELATMAQTQAATAPTSGATPNAGAAGAAAPADPNAAATTAAPKKAKANPSATPKGGGLFGPAPRPTKPAAKPGYGN
jgi:hypothetical protein